jgi:hypothetical protein
MSTRRVSDYANARVAEARCAGEEWADREAKAFRRRTMKGLAVAPDWQGSDAEALALVPAYLDDEDRRKLAAFLNRAARNRWTELRATAENLAAWNLKPT